MPLRNPNNPDTDVVILGVLKNVINQDQFGNHNTALAASSASGTGAELVFIQNKYKMSLAMTPTQAYAVHLSSGKQVYHYAGGPRAREGMYVALVEYYGRWDVQPSSIDDIRAYIATDLERIKSNIESNDALTFGSVANVISIPEMSLSEYKGEFDTTFQGLTLVYRTLSLSINILPYDA